MIDWATILRQVLTHTQEDVETQQFKATADVLLGLHGGKEVSFLHGNTVQLGTEYIALVVQKSRDGGCFTTIVPYSSIVYIRIG